MKLNFNFSGKTLLKDWWKIVRDNFTAIQTDHNELSDSVNTHKTAEVIDHPDKSVTSTKIADKAIRTAHIANYAITKDKVANGAVTTDKIAANSITVNELTLDIVANLGKANTFLYSDGEPIYLSECKDTGGIGYELPDDIPVNVFFKLENDTDSALTKFQSHDDYYTTLSCDIAPGEVRICVLIQEEVGGADPQNGYLFVLDDNSIRKLLNDKAPTNHASGATTYGVGDATNYGHLKLSDSTASVSSTGSGIAATPKAVKTISDTLSTEISDRQAADNELKAKIADINSELTTDNLFYDLSKYVNSDNKLVTDDSGVQYLSYSDLFENGVYLYHNFVVDNFRRKPKTETTLELTFNVASRHIAGDGCDSGGLNIGETDVLITYTDTTTETFGQSYYTATDTGDKTITINGTSETYKTTKFKIEIPVKKEIKSISFRIVSDNFYTNGDPTGNACKQKTLIQSAVCYDDECVAVLRDDINANTSKITANTTKLTTEISDRQAADDELKAKFTDLKTVAFTGSYTDLSNKPTSMQNPNSLTLTMNGSATSYNGSATASKSWYAPTSAGTTGYNLISNGSGAPIWQQPPYAVCPDSPSISDRRLSITNFKLLTGVRVLVRFTYPFAGTQGKVTLNVNSTGAKEVKLLRADGSYDAITQYNSWSTNEIVEFVYDGTYWVALSSDKQFVSGKPSVITVGSSTVTRYCDFKCSGTDDDIVIQKAMDSLTDGGKIILLEGTYNLSSRLLQKKNVVIEGQGRGITKVNTSYIFLISNLVGTSPTLHLTNMDINFLSTSNISPNAGAFNDYDVLQIDNCSISYANTMHNTDSIFFNCKVKLKNSRISVTLPAKRYDNSHPCWWIFRDCTAEIIDTDIIFPTTSNNTLSNGVFYRCEGSMVGGFIKHIGTTVSSNHSYIEDDSTMNIIGTQIECRRFSQSETTTGNFNSLANCRIKILQAEGYFSASHINHCDLYISASVIFCAYCMASNCKLWFSAASLATLKNYCFFEACYTNQSTWIGTNGTGTSTTDTKTVSGMAAPSFRSVS